QRVAHDSEKRRTRHGVPRHDQRKRKERERPRWEDPVHRVSDRGERYEGNQCEPASVAVSDPSARILVHAVEKVFRRAERANCRDWSAERLEGFGEKTAPKILATTEQEHARRNGHDFRRESEVLDRTLASAREALCVADVESPRYP